MIYFSDNNAARLCNWGCSDLNHATKWLSRKNLVTYEMQIAGKRISFSNSLWINWFQLQSVEEVEQNSVKISCSRCAIAFESTKPLDVISMHIQFHLYSNICVLPPTIVQITQNLMNLSSEESHKKVSCIQAEFQSKRINSCFNFMVNAHAIDNYSSFSPRSTTLFWCNPSRCS